MRHFAVLVLLAASVLADYADEERYSFNPPVGSGSGTSYVVEGDGPVTAVRVWERYNSYIYGLQLRYGTVWSLPAGIQSGVAKEFELFEGEAIVQVSGKYAHYVNSLVFVTSAGRSMWVGQPSGGSFNMYPEHQGAELVILSGRYHGALTSLGAHWAPVPRHDAH